jgi:hypothetical protein
VRRGTNSRSFFDIEALRLRLGQLEEAMAAQEFWQDKKRSEETLREVSSIKSAIEPVERVSALIHRYSTNSRPIWIRSRRISIRWSSLSSSPVPTTSAT